MSNYFLDVDGALNGHLFDMVGKPSIAWSNKTFEPVTGETYIRPTLLTGDTIPATFDDDMTDGVYQVDIFTESGTGKKDIFEMADLIADQFAVDTQLTYGSVTVQIKTVNQKAARNNGDGWYQMPIEIVYYVFTARR